MGCINGSRTEDRDGAARSPWQVKKSGLVVVKNMKIIGLHCSSTDLHAGQIALIKHGSRLKNCDLYFSRKPCSTCLKMIVNGLENLCENPYFSNLRQNMKDLVLVLATVAASVPDFGCFGFYNSESRRTNETDHQGLPQEIARHCMIQARLLAYRTEDHKTGVGAIIWAEEKSLQRSCDGTGAMYFVGCGYNAFPVGSEYADFPHMDDKQKDREIRKFRYIIHAEQNALTFRIFTPMRGRCPSDTSHCLCFLLGPCYNLKYGSVAIAEAFDDDMCGEDGTSGIARIFSGANLLDDNTWREGDVRTASETVV
ncbi:cytidine and dcmp deaminase domain-containing protein 1 [Limosa lapponica baueri]|uniref:Cytidine and dCMP deaminase domain-containing protein 1 n=1 Tax=Limosa lapponica baueri TaxID=1758121 RepID=A0A2I0U3A1_LIMLA|nr:cytidine and dcmp deaminase domain-containing protein 1 [Limosa lapponica baueri]